MIFWLFFYKYLTALLINLFFNILFSEISTINFLDSNIASTNSLKAFAAFTNDDAV